jgi:hypothetical protein
MFKGRQCKAAGVTIYKNDKDTTDIVTSQMDVVFSNNIQVFFATLGHPVYYL